MLKQKVKLNNRDVNIRISLGSSNNLGGYQQEINNLTSFNSLDIVNPVEDEEVRRFEYMFNNLNDIRFAFHVPESNTFEPSLTQSGFLESDINNGNRAIQNSFYLVDFYDTFNKFSQTKIFSNYNSKIIEEIRGISTSRRRRGSTEDDNGRRRRGDSGDEDSGIDITNLTIYRINRASQFFFINIPVWYIDSIKSGEFSGYNYGYGDNGNSVIIYTKFLFYNAKTGRIVSFYNADNATLTTDERYYVKTEINLDNFTWRFISPSVLSENTLQLREIERNRNQKFNEKINKTVDSFNEERITPPTGNAFDDIDGSYRIM